jgi:hypothetical protein
MPSAAARTEARSRASPFNHGHPGELEKGLFVLEKHVLASHGGTAREPFEKVLTLTLL